jgi:hypothetical protein
MLLSPAFLAFLSLATAIPQHTSTPIPWIEPVSATAPASPSPTNPQLGSLPPCSPEQRGQPGTFFWEFAIHGCHRFLQHGPFHVNASTTALFKSTKILFGSDIFDMITYIVGASNITNMDQAGCEQGSSSMRGLEDNRDGNNLCTIDRYGDIMYKSWEFEHDNRVYKADTQGASESRINDLIQPWSEVYWTGPS